MHIQEQHEHGKAVHRVLYDDDGQVLLEWKARKDHETGAVSNSKAVDAKLKKLMEQ